MVARIFQGFLGAPKNANGNRAEFELNATSLQNQTSELVLVYYDVQHQPLGAGGQGEEEKETAPHYHKCSAVRCTVNMVR
jgi:hypothetical protein